MQMMPLLWACSLVMVGKAILLLWLQCQCKTWLKLRNNCFFMAHANITTKGKAQLRVCLPPCHQQCKPMEQGVAAVYQDCRHSTSHSICCLYRPQLCEQVHLPQQNSPDIDQLKQPLEATIRSTFILSKPCGTACEICWP